MLVEKFVIFKFENIFYTKEELEELGFRYMTSKEDYIALNLSGYIPRGLPRS